jgi:hypothetical protein
VSNLSKLARLRKGRASPQQQVSLFDHAERIRVRTLPLPARWIARTRGVAPATALLIAEALFNSGGDK